MVQRIALYLGIPMAALAALAGVRLFAMQEWDPARQALWWTGAVTALDGGVVGLIALRASRIRAEQRRGEATLARQQDRLTLETREQQTKIDFLTAEREIGMILNDDLEYAVVLDRVLELTAHLLHADPDGELGLYLRAPEGALKLAAARIRGRAIAPKDLKHANIGDGLVDPARLQSRIVYASEGDHVNVWIPLTVEGAIAAVLLARVPSETDLTMLEPFIEEYARFLALSVKTPELYARAVYDPLTGLGTRRQFNSQLAERVKRGRRFTLIMVDIDHFKKVNDTHGHLAGDEVLRGVAETIRKNVRRDSDAAADGFRYGGEEMAVLLDRVGRDGAGQIAERLRAAIEKRSFGARGKPVDVTISLGVAEFAGDTAEGLIARADACLYKAKDSGRNRVVLG